MNRSPAHLPPCDTCGAPGVMIVQDFKQAKVPGSEFRDYQPLGKPRTGCAEHPVDSVRYLDDGITVEPKS